MFCNWRYINHLLELGLKLDWSSVPIGLSLAQLDLDTLRHAGLEQSDYTLCYSSNLRQL